MVYEEIKNTKTPPEVGQFWWIRLNKQPKCILVIICSFEVYPNICLNDVLKDVFYFIDREYIDFVQQVLPPALKDT